MSKFAFLIVACLLAVPTFTALAQDNVTVVTDDMVRDIAEHMYCPICENEPLDDCRNPTCIQWKNEIGDQLAAGRSEAQIVDYFVTRYGEQVIGVPRDPFLRALALAAPIVGTIIALIFAAATFGRWQRNQSAEPAPATASRNAGDDAYRQQLEQDLL